MYNKRHLYRGQTIGSSGIGVNPKSAEIGFFPIEMTADLIQNGILATPGIASPMADKLKGSESIEGFTAPGEIPTG
ncbi:MAG: hypothetical protein JRL30_15480 [Deltaproteobacteria bacterium]|nr:hypothetical protein [Deltaproteobacteria bacterium]